MKCCYTILLSVCSTALYAQTDSAERQVIFMHEDTPAFYYPDDKVQYGEYVIKEVDKTKYPLFIVIRAMKPDSYEVDSFRYHTNTGNMSAADVDKLSGKKVLIRYRQAKYLNHALKISSVD